jgi:hypothetical protein
MAAGDTLLKNVEIAGPLWKGKGGAVDMHTIHM